VNYETQVLALIREGNPIQDPDTLTVDQSDSAVYLATLTTRSSEMTQVEEEKKDPEERRPLIPWLAAAAAVVILGVALVLMNQGGEETPVVTEPTPTTAIDASPTTVPAETTVPAPTTTIDPWNELTTWSGQQWGEVRVTNFTPQMSFTVPDGWGRSCLPSPSAFDMIPASFVEGTTEAAFESSAGIVVVRLGFGTVDETVSELTSKVGGVSATTETSIGGAPGVVFDATDAEETSTLFVVDGSCAFSVGLDLDLRFWVIEVLGETVTFILNTSAGELETAAAESQPVLDSIVWKDLS